MEFRSASLVMEPLVDCDSEHTPFALNQSPLHSWLRAVSNRSSLISQRFPHSRSQLHLRERQDRPEGQTIDNSQLSTYQSDWVLREPPSVDHHANRVYDRLSVTNTLEAIGMTHRFSARTGPLVFALAARIVCCVRGRAIQVRYTRKDGQRRGRLTVSRISRGFGRTPPSLRLNGRGSLRAKNTLRKGSGRI